MAWEKHARELIALGREHHPEAIERFLCNLQWVGVSFSDNMDEIIQSLPETCRKQAQTIFKMAKQEGLDGWDFADAIKLMINEPVQPQVEPAPQVAFTAVELYSPYYDAFGATPY